MLSHYWGNIRHGKFRWYRVFPSLSWSWRFKKETWTTNLYKVIISELPNLIISISRMLAFNFFVNDFFNARKEFFIHKIKITFYIFIYLTLIYNIHSFFLSIYLFIYLSFYLYIFLSIYISLSFFLFIYLSFYLYIFLSKYLSTK